MVEQVVAAICIVRVVVMASEQPACDYARCRQLMMQAFAARFLLDDGVVHDP